MFFLYMLCELYNLVNKYYLNQIPPLATFFRRMFYVYHHAMKHHQANIFVLLFSIPFVLKCGAKNENLFIKKKKKIIIIICIGKGDNPEIFNFGF